VTNGSGPCRLATDRKVRGLGPQRAVPPFLRQAAWIFPWVASLVAAAPEPVAIHWETARATVAVEVTGIGEDSFRTSTSEFARDAAEWSRIFAVFAEQKVSVAATGTKPDAMPPMAGTWTWAKGRLRFEPQFPLAHGVRYRAEYRPEKGPPLVSFFELPAAVPGTPTEVVQIFPSASELPENQLKFYVEFSAPMSRGGTYRHVVLRDAAGRVVDLPFLELDEELWDLSMTRLTLLIDPGRIKRGVKPQMDDGPVFQKGNAYTLTLQADCRDAEGRPLRAKFEKKFRIVAADRTPPDPRRWTIHAPATGSRAPLVVEFDEPMDQALALRLIGVVQGENARVSGDAALDREERRWTFSPDQPWQVGPHRLTIGSTIEDLAGNNIGKTFDVDLASGAPRRMTGEAVTVAFEVK
jgi:hypothetical protein